MLLQPANIGLPIYFTENYRKVRAATTAGLKLKNRVREYGRLLALIGHVKQCRFRAQRSRMH